MKKIKIDVKAIIVIALVLIIILAENSVLSRILMSAVNDKVYFNKYMGIYMLFHVYEVTTQATFSIIYYVFNYVVIALVLFLFFWKKKYSLIPSAILLIENVLSILGIFALRDNIAQNSSLPSAAAWNVIKKVFRISPDTYVAIICLIAIIVIVIMNSNFKKQPKAITNDSKVDNAEEIMKYKQLLDSGLISQEEFDKKKNVLLS